MSAMGKVCVCVCVFCVCVWGGGGVFEPSRTAFLVL